MKFGGRGNFDCLTEADWRVFEISIFVVAKVKIL